MTIHDPRDAGGVTLPVQRAFAVHFGAAGRGRRFAGRVEHLASGRSVRFTSLRALLAFFDEMLDGASGQTRPGAPSRSAAPRRAAPADRRR